MDNINDLIKELKLNQTLNDPILIAIDGRPLSGKSTLADNLAEILNAQILNLDDFFIPKNQWTTDIKPKFPFFYFRYAEFLQGIKLLANKKEFKYFSYNWETNELSKIPTIIKPTGIIIVEGTSVFHKDIIDLFYKKIWVISNTDNELEALLKREGKKNLELWEKIYLPSVNIYFATEPWSKADIVFKGRTEK